MKHGYRNITKIARQTCGLTQERFAEMLDISPECVRQYENGKIMPGDEVVIKMVELSAMPVLGYWHLLNKSRVAAGILPEVDYVGLPQSVCRLIARAQRLPELTYQLAELAEDGQITPEESAEFNRIADELDGLIAAAMCVKMARREDAEC